LPAGIVEAPPVFTGTAVSFVVGRQLAEAGQFRLCCAAVRFSLLVAELAPAFPSSFAVTILAVQIREKTQIKSPLYCSLRPFKCYKTMMYQKYCNNVPIVARIPEEFAKES
jgi:hypothetical protein